jgi:lipopolysaccharide export system protein LptC
MDAEAAKEARKLALDRLSPVRGAVDGVNPGYSRFVSMMKVGLPIIALALIVMVLAWPRLQTDGKSFQLTFASIGDDESGATGMINARFIGTDAENRPYIITAETASQANASGDIITLNMLQADMTLNSGAWVTMMADKGVYYRLVDRLELIGPVDFFSDLGYEFHAGDTIVDLAASAAESPHGVSGQGPFGVLTADSFRFTDNGRRIYFKGAVKLTIDPVGR